MTKTLYLMRHGQTRFNHLKRIQGASDSPLTDLGIEQARQAGAYLAHIDFDAIYSSTQERAVDTAELVSGRTDIIRLKGLKEMDFGTFEGQSESLNPPLRPGIGYGDYFIQHSGEGSVAVRERMKETLSQILAKHQEGETILAVSHGAAIALFYRGVLAHPPQVRMSNCAILHFEVDQNNYDLISIYDPVNQKVLFHKEGS